LEDPLHNKDLTLNLARLRDLIATEEEMYMQEAADKEETLLERQARMRERARILRERREKERAKEAEMKLEQRWRYSLST
jgi:predicted acyltransferase (DUF342 family)